MNDLQANGSVDAARHAARRTFVVTGALLLLALIIVAERSGLPRETARLAALCLLAAVLVFGALGHATALEGPFVGWTGALVGGMPAVALGAGLFAGVDGLLRAVSLTSYAAQGLGCAAGVCLAHALTRLADRPHGAGHSSLPA
ncbi:MAG: hypothetical protein ACRC7G_15790, partial [Beijerinckiaceae bacterium]